MRSSTISKMLGILVAAVLVGGFIGWLASRNPSQPQPPPAKVPDAEIAATEPIPAPVVPPVQIRPPEITPPVEPEVAVNTDLNDPALWEEKLDEILGTDEIEESKKGEILLEMMAKVGPEAQVELAGHVVNLLDDDQFHQTAKYLTNAAISEEISSIFMNDLYNRDEAVKLPLLLDVARNEEHVLRDEARDLLELYVEEDYGTNWTQWEEATKKYLKEQAAEGEPAPGETAPN